MELTNPYVASISAGLLVFLYTYNFKSSKDAKGDKQTKQTNMNYIFLTSLVVFIGMNYYCSNTGTIEKTLQCGFDE